MKNKDGDVLQKFIPLQQEELLNSPQYQPLTHSLIVARHRGKTLLVHDRYKNRWEVPGGRIEPGETPRECILREMKEETGQTPASIQLEGVMQLYTKRLFSN